MGDAETLAALFGVGGTKGAYADINQFEDILAKNNLWRRASAPLSAAKFDMSTWSPTEQIGVSAGQAFISALLNGLGQRSEANQMSLAAKVLPQLYRDPEAVAVPEGLDPEAFGALKLSTIKEKAAQDFQKEELKTKLFAEMFSRNPALASQLMPTKAKDFGLDVAIPQMGEDPDSAAYKIAQDKRKIEEQYTEKLLTGTQANLALNLNKAASNIFKALEKENPLTASTAIFEFAKLQDPTGTVREADEMRVSDAGGPLGQLARIHNEIMQKGKLTPDAKIAMREIVPFMVENQFQSYNQLRDSYLDAAKSYGADPSRVQFVKPVDLSSYLNQGGAGGAGASVEGQLQAIRDQLLRPDISIEERALLKQKAFSLVSPPRSAGGSPLG